MDNPDHSDFIRPEQAVAFDRDEFMFTMQVGSETARAGGFLTHPPDRKFGIIGYDGKVTRYSFSDIPENRFALAVLQRYRGQTAKFSSFMFRWFALMDVLHSGLLGDRYFRQAADGDREIHDSVIALAASFPLTASGKFDHAAFLEALSKLESPPEDPAA